MTDKLYVAGMIALVCICTAGLLWMSKAMAQAVPPAYEGCTIAWEYPTNVANHSGFRLTIDGIQGNTQIQKAARSIKCADTTLAGKPFAEYTMRLVATASAPAVNSPAAVLKFAYQARPTLQPPTAVKLIMEWELTP